MSKVEDDWEKSIERILGWQKYYSRMLKQLLLEYKYSKEFRNARLAFKRRLQRTKAGH